MKDALNVVRKFTFEGNLSEDGSINTTTMREMWDYENEEPSLGKNKEASKVILEGLRMYNCYPMFECELCGGNHEIDQVPP